MFDSVSAEILLLFGVSHQESGVREVGDPVTPGCCWSVSLVLCKNSFMLSKNSREGMKC